MDEWHLSHDKSKWDLIVVYVYMLLLASLECLYMGELG